MKEPEPTWEPWEGQIQEVKIATETDPIDAEPTARHHIRTLYRNALNLIDIKAHDYAQGSAGKQAHSNFIFAELVQASFDEPLKSYAVLIGTKLARIAELSKGKKPMNESLEDSFKDLINYVGLMYERIKLDDLSKR